MAAVTLLGSVLNTTAGAKNVTATPAIDDLIVLIVAHTGVSPVTWSDPSDDAGGTYTQIGSYVNNALGGNTSLGAYVRDTAITSASSTVFTAPAPTSDTGGGLFVIKVTGQGRYGTDAIRQSTSSTQNTNRPILTFGSAKLTTNAVIGVATDSDGLNLIDPTSGYTEIFDSTYITPFLRVEIQSINSGDSSTQLIWPPGTSVTGANFGIEIDTSTPPVVVDLTAASFGITPQNPTVRRAITTSVALLKFVANTQQLRRTNQIQISSLDFNRQVFQSTTVNNQTADTFDFVQPDISVGNSITLSAASVGFVADTVQLAIVNNIAEGSLNLTGEPTEQVIGTTLSVASMDFVGIDLAPVQIVALDSATFGFTAQTATPAAVITLVEEPMDFVVLDVNPSNAPLGEVVNLVTAAFDFAVNTIRGVNSITLDTANFGFAATEISSTSINNLAASDLKLTPQNLTVTQDVVQVLLEAATFNFVARSLQPTGIASVGDKKRMLFGVGR